MDDANIALKLEEISKNFGGIKASNEININIPQNMIYGIIGPNGAGKTTLFNMITGVYTPTKGDIKFFGKSIIGKKTHEIATLGIARTFQNIRLFGDLTVYENVLIACQKNITYNFWQSLLKTSECRRQEKTMADICETALKNVGLSEHKDQRAKNLPYGMQRRLEIARGLVTNPKIILLDEPAAGMNEDESKQLAGFIKEILNGFGITIIIIDHHMDVIMSICDRISVLNFGKLLAEGTPDEIQNNQEVIEAYLGVDE
ncbi:ABC transporter ATP-binding protein [Petroclostridium sp. X23]|uniref:ABC transporter ATP-binding protein n=1 Tax=Petroclostridium sp. X23 TaxID=3045146 RepID=UPI0024AD8A4C|nr:ABC transporter ATP-binding protein [Petroclostridium sp. X23]WHH61261.1 ABC transporter ATP-binding protein [Petroclostridium sp. X23]